VRDLLFHLPRDYQDRRRITPIAEAREGETITILAEVVRGRALRLRGRRSMAEVTLRDTTGEIKATWFGRGFLARALASGTQALFTGRVGKYAGLALQNPDYELFAYEEDGLQTGRVVPMYPLTKGITHRMMRRWVHTALEHVNSPLDETLPEYLMARHGFPLIDEAIRDIHFPSEIESGRAARNRFAYEELLRLQLGILQERVARQSEEKGIRHVTDGPRLHALSESLPFALTRAQERAVNDVLSDMASPRPMVRLLQGDVGCGKTVVALHAVAAAADGGFQTALMAPTEILAEQHYLTLRDFVEPLGLRVDILTGCTQAPAAARKKIASGGAEVIVGTQALIQEKVAFARLGLVIIDEQHRFGVVQRSALVAKGFQADILHMTATPIPRTLAITLYGGMDITVIDELPPGRQPVLTRRILPAKVPELYQYVRDQAGQGFQTYYICPVIEESETRDLTPLIRRFRELSSEVFPGLRVGMIHGRLPSREKEALMHHFKLGDIQVLFSTTVIEVGIDVPKATTMVIEDAGGFGLTQLHQLRGRIGRGPEQAHCFVLGTPKTPEGRRRLEILCQSSSGFDIAEEDLKLRGPGEFYGLRQAGFSDLGIADLVRDVRLLDCARRDAIDILASDPSLSEPRHRCLAVARRSAMVHA
jgi:ATP-dependent DNA helicase RecG